MARIITVILCLLLTGCQRQETQVSTSEDNFTYQEIEKYFKEFQTGDLINIENSHYISNLAIPGRWKHTLIYLGTEAQVQKMISKESRYYQKIMEMYLDKDEVVVLDANVGGVQLRYFKQMANLKDESYLKSMVCYRFVKEKEFDKLIMAFSDLNLQDYHLVIAGDSDHKTSYSTYLKELARKKQVILTGMVKGESLKELYSHAGLFVLPSSHEGLPITLLEAMSYNIDTLVSDIPANLAVGLSKEHYFKVNHMNSLKQQLTYKIYQNNYPVYYDLKAYNWDHIAQQTFNVYNNLLNV